LYRDGDRDRDRRDRLEEFRKEEVDPQMD